MSEQEFLIAPVHAVRWRTHSDLPYSVAIVGDPDEQAEQIRGLFEKGIVAEAVTITYTADAEVNANVRAELVNGAIERILAGKTTNLDELRWLRPLTPRLADFDSKVPTPRCARGYWIDEALMASRALARNEDDDEASDRFDEAVEVLAGNREHGTNGRICTACHRGKSYPAQPVTNGASR